MFAAGRYFGEEGWRPFSPSRTASAFVAGTYQNGATTAELSLAAADTRLTGNGPAPRQLLAQNRRAIFTYPDITDDRMFMAVARGERPLAAMVKVSGVAYFRATRIATLNGDQADWLACQDPAAAGFVCTAGEAGAEMPVVDDAGNPVPYDATNPYDAAENTTRTRQESHGVAAQVAVGAPVAGRENHLFVGAAANEGRASFTSQSALARLTQPDRGTMSAGIVDAGFARRRRQRQPRPGAVRDRHAVAAARSVPDGRRALQRFDADAGGSPGRGPRRRSQLPPPEPGAGHQLSAAARRGRIRGVQRVDARADAAGADLRQRDGSVPAAERLHLRSAAGAGRRAHLRGRRARTLEARAATTLDYVVAAFRTTNADDILFISSGTVANRGYFANVGDTRRQGVEASLIGRRRLAGGGGSARLEWAIHYTYLDARFLTAVHGAVGVASRRRRRNDRRSGGRAHPERPGPHRQGGCHVVRGRRRFGGRRRDRNRARNSIGATRRTCWRRWPASS